MHMLLLCGPEAHTHHQEALPLTAETSTTEPSTAQASLAIRELSDIPTRSELAFINTFHQEFVTGHTPSLDDIAKQPDVPHQAAPQPDPHPTSESVRIIVAGTDAALAAVASKLMRVDALFTELAYIPLNPASPVATIWGLPPHHTFAEALDFARHAPAQPTPLVRDDHGHAILGQAEITGPAQASTQESTQENTQEGTQPNTLIGEVVVDSDQLYFVGDATSADHNPYVGVRLAPTLTAPGIMAVQLPKPPQSTKPRGIRATLSALFSNANAAKHPPRVLQGRAAQAGGQDIRVVRDGIPHPRPLNSATFYRHLRDGQFVRN